MGGGWVGEMKKNSEITTEVVRGHIVGAQQLKSMEQVKPRHWAPSSHFHLFHHTVRVPCSLPCSMVLSGQGEAQALQIADQSERLLTDILPAVLLPRHQQ